MSIWVNPKIAMVIISGILTHLFRGILTHPVEGLFRSILTHLRMLKLEDFGV